MTSGFLLSDYDYPLPPELIAQHPSKQRDASRLMILGRHSGGPAHGSFPDFVDQLRPGDCLVMNDSKVFPARLLGRKPTGGKVEFLLLHYPLEEGPGTAGATAMYRSSKRLREGQSIHVGENLDVEVAALLPDGHAKVLLHFEGDLLARLQALGHVPLPPYIRREDTATDQTRYQTVYASAVGSVAAPTAGLHFTEEIMESIRAKGVEIGKVTLHVGHGTFAPIRSEDIRDHRLHAEWCSLSPATAEMLARARREGRRVVAVGTTSVRTLEAAGLSGELQPFEGLCDLFIRPGHTFQVVDAILTNFHLPGSSLLVLVSAFAGRERVLSAYQEAVREGYRFFSYGDAMFITPDAPEE